MNNKLKIFSFVYLSLLAIFFGCTDDAEVLVGIENGRKLDERDLVPFTLEQNYPNPFNPETQIRYQVGIPLHLTFKVYTEDWLEIATLFDTHREPGDYTINFSSNSTDYKTLPSGEYYYTLSGNDITLIRKMKLIK